MKLSKQVFILSVVFIHVFYLATAGYYQSWLNPDSADYIEQAYNLVHHGSLYARVWEALPHDPGMLTLRPPLYAVIVLITYTCFASPILLLILQGVLSMSLWLNIRKLILEVTERYKPGIRESSVHLVLILGILFYPVQNFMACTIMSDTLFQYLFVLGACNLVRFLITKKQNHFAWYTIFFTLALLTKPVLVFYAFINMALCAWWFFTIQRDRKILIWSVLMPVIVLLVSLFNEKQTGYYHYSSSRVENLLIYNTTNLLNMKYGHDSGYVLKKQILIASQQQTGYKAQCKWVDSACKNVILANSGDYAFYHLQGMLNFFVAPGREYFISFFQMQEPERMSFIKEINDSGWNGILKYLKGQSIFLVLISGIVTVWNLILLIALCFFFFQRNIPWSIRISLLLLMGYIAGVSSLAAGAARFRLPVYPLLVFCLLYLDPTSLFRKKNSAMKK